MCAKTDRGLPEDIEAYLKILQGSWASPAILLFGSRAGDSPSRWSDYDVLVIAEDLPQEFWERQAVLWKDKPACVDVIGLTPQEVRDIIHRGLILDALLQGKPLAGDASEFKELALAHVREHGLVRTEAGYVHAPTS